MIIPFVVKLCLEINHLSKKCLATKQTIHIHTQSTQSNNHLLCHAAQEGDIPQTMDGNHIMLYSYAGGKNLQESSPWQQWLS